MNRTYEVGDRGPAVAEIRQMLGALGLLPATAGHPAESRRSYPVCDDYDSAVELAVRAFQQQRGLTVDGRVGVQTYRALEEARWRLGDRILSLRAASMMAGDDVATLQRRLLDMGFDSGRVDGIFGPNTDRALRDFQRNIGLVVDGTCGPQTFKALDRLTRTVVGGRPHALREETALSDSGPALSGKVVVVDPGHGGGDRGVSGHGLEEAALVEDLAARIEGRLAATGVLTFLTRGSDGDVDEAERAAFANAADADLLISLHVDAAPTPAANGVATFFYGADRYGHSSAAGEKFAELVQREIVARTGLLNCRTHPKTWDILRRTRMPAVRLEVGYVTSPTDARRLADARFRDVVAEAVVIAVRRLFLPAEEDPPTGTLKLSELART